MNEENLAPSQANKERNEFAKTYIDSVRDHVLGNLMDQFLESKLSELRPGFRAAIDSMNEAQQGAMRTLIAQMVDTQSVMLLSLTSAADSPWSIVKRDRATLAGLESLSNGFRAVEGEFFDWIATYSRFTYEPNDRKRQFLVKMKEIEEFFFEIMEDYESFKPQFEGARRIRLEMQKLDLTRVDVENVIRIVNEVAETEHHNGASWHEYLMHVSYLFSINGFFAEIDGYTGRMHLVSPAI